MESIVNQRSAADIQALKNDWEYDPCWDIEMTEGFEAHREELLAYSDTYKARKNQEWEEEQEARRVEQRQIWGTAPDAALDYIANLEGRVLRLEEKVSMLKPSSLYTE